MLLYCFGQSSPLNFRPQLSIISFECIYMPKPIPPPPPQPTEETKIQLFGLETLLFSHCCLLQMHNSIVHKHSLLNMDGICTEWTQKNQKNKQRTSFTPMVNIWLIGSSMLRDAFDETYRGTIKTRQFLYIQNR